MRGECSTNLSRVSEMIEVTGRVWFDGATGGRGNTIDAAHAGFTRSYWTRRARGWMLKAKTKTTLDISDGMLSSQHLLMALKISCSWIYMYIKKVPFKLEIMQGKEWIINDTCFINVGWITYMETYLWEVPHTTAVESLHIHDDLFAGWGQGVGVITLHTQVFHDLL